MSSSSPSQHAPAAAAPPPPPAAAAAALAAGGGFGGSKGVGGSGSGGGLDLSARLYAPSMHAGALTQRAPAAPWAVSRAPRTRDCSPPALPTPPGALCLFAERHR